MKWAEKIANEGKKKSVLAFLEPLKDQAPDYVRGYLQGARWKAREAKP